MPEATPPRRRLPREVEDRPDIGADGTVLLRSYLPNSDLYSLAACCSTWRGCGRFVCITIEQAMALAGDDATVGQFERRLRCSACGGRRVAVQIAVDSRPAWTRT